MRVCVLGDSGLVGQELVQQLLLRGDEVLGVSYSDFRPTQYWRVSVSAYRHLSIPLPEGREALRAEFLKFKPALVVNCVGLVDMNLCEREPDLARLVNVTAAAVAGAEAQRNGAQYIHISTDQVFDGQGSASYSESDPTGPINVYGVTKLEAEQAVLQECANALIVRSNMVGFRDRPRSSTFGEWLCSALMNREPITLFSDYVTSSIHVEDLVGLMLAAHGRGATGVLHIAASDHVSKHQFALMVAEHLKIETENITMGSLRHLAGARRPPWLALNTKKLTSLLPHPTPVPPVAETARKLARDCLRRVSPKP